LKKRDKMESLHMLVSEVTDKAHGYGLQADRNSHVAKILAMWAKFYDMKIDNNQFGFPSLEEVRAAMDTSSTDPTEPTETSQPKPPPPEWKKYFRSHQPNAYSPTVYINFEIYKKRIRIIIEPFLEEANLRAAEENKLAYIHAIGLGLGVWQICPTQAEWMIEVYRDLLRESNYSHIAVIDFSWFPGDLEKEFPKEITTKEGKPIQIIFSRRDPAQKLDDTRYLLVAMYAWDGNSYPGNEYWRGMLHASGDPAAACCSTIAELQNPEINVDFVKRIYWHPASEGEKKQSAL